MNELLEYLTKKSYILEKLSNNLIISKLIIIRNDPQRNNNNQNCNNNSLMNNSETIKFNEDEKGEVDKAISTMSKYYENLRNLRDYFNNITKNTLIERMITKQSVIFNEKEKDLENEGNILAIEENNNKIINDDYFEDKRKEIKEKISPSNFNKKKFRRNLIKEIELPLDINKNIKLRKGKLNKNHLRNLRNLRRNKESIDGNKSYDNYKNKIDLISSRGKGKNKRNNYGNSLSNTTSDSNINNLNNINNFSDSKIKRENKNNQKLNFNFNFNFPSDEYKNILNKKNFLKDNNTKNFNVNLNLNLNLNQNYQNSCEAMNNINTNSMIRLKNININDLNNLKNKFMLNENDSNINKNYLNNTDFIKNSNKNNNFILKKKKNLGKFIDRENNLYDDNKDIKDIKDNNKGKIEREKALEFDSPLKEQFDFNLLDVREILLNFLLSFLLNFLITLLYHQISKIAENLNINEGKKSNEDKTDLDLGLNSDTHLIDNNNSNIKNRKKNIKLRGLNTRKSRYSRIKRNLESF